MENLIKSLKSFQADYTVFYHLVHGFQVNTESVLMRQSRIVYEDIYKDAEKATHDTAEWLRKIGVESLYTIEEFLAHKTFGDVKPDTYCGVEMAVHLVPINEKMIKDIVSLIEESNKEKQYALSLFLSERLNKHQEWDWFLKSSLKLPPNPWKSLKD